MRDSNTNAIPFDEPLRDALRDRVACDSIRSIHINGMDMDLLPSVIPLLILDGEGTRCSSIESLILDCDGLDISNFLACRHFPKLRNLSLTTSAGISSWDHLKLLQATSLTTLSLDYGQTPTTLTTSQLLSTLASYPNLQDLSLYESTIPHDVGNGLTFRVPLHHLKKLYLRGDCRHVSLLLERLEYPDTLDHVDLGLFERVDFAEGTSESIAPFLQDRIRRDGRFQGRLKIHLSAGLIHATFKIEFNIPTTPQGYSHPSMTFQVLFRDDLPRGIGDKVCISLAALTPRERVVALTGDLYTYAMRDLVATMPNIEDLYLMQPMVFDAFLQPDPPSHTNLLPSLRRLCLYYPTLQNDDDWSPFMNYLAHQTSDGQVISLWLYGEHVPPGVVGEIEDLVEEFSLDYRRTWGG